MRSLETAVQWWREFKQYENLSELKEAVRLDGRNSLDASASRSACWKAFLLFNHVDTERWRKTITPGRQAYKTVREHLLRHIENADELTVGFDPLSEESETSPWALRHNDEELRAEILQDVERCMPEISYFRLPETQRMLLDILFVFCKLNPDVGYRQGMHELLAPVLWVVDRDAIEPGGDRKTAGSEAAIVDPMFDAKYIEHDTFALFSQIMHNAKNFYEQTTHSGKVNPMVARSERIFEELLPQVDPELARHLKKIDIVPQIFLMRWIRLLFGREFPFDDVLAMWDVIFAEDASLEIVDHVCVAMLLRIRWELLEAEFNGALTLLLGYADINHDRPLHPQTFVIDALYLRDHLSREGGSYIILKYSGRPPRNPDRAATPPALQRNITAFSGTNAAKAAALGTIESSSDAPQQGRTMESVLMVTARNIMARSEALGITSAVRNAVDEVHKRAQEIRETAQTPSPSPAWRPRGARTSPGAFLKRINALEERNRQLAKYLEDAVAELWDCQKIAAEEQEWVDATPSKVDQLGMAIAKVQFVQVYLADPSLPFPDLAAEASYEQGPLQSGMLEDKEANNMDADQLNAMSNAEESVVHQASEKSADAENTTKSTTQFGELADPSAFDDYSPPSTPTRDAITHPVKPEEASGAEPKPPLTVLADENVSTIATAEDSALDTGTSRPPLAQSSFSWMLGQQELEGQAKNRGLPSISDRPGARKYLFGEEDRGDETSSPQAGVRSRRSSKTAASANSIGETSFDLGTMRRGKGLKK